MKFARSASPLAMPRIESALMGLSETIRLSDIIALTTNATYSPTLNAVQVPVIRKVLAADKTAHYKQGTPVAGLLGIPYEQGVSNASGYITGTPPAPGVTTNAAPVFSFPSMSSGRPVEPSTKLSRVRYYPFCPQNIFSCALDPTATISSPLLINTLAGLILTTDGNGVTTYTVDTGAAALDQCLRIIGCDENDPLYNTAAGGVVYVQALDAFSQLLTDVVYSSQ